MTTGDRHGIDDVLRAFGGDNRGTLRLEAGMPARILGADGSTRDLSSRPLTRQEILSLVGPVVPEHARRLLPKEPSVDLRLRVGDWRLHADHDPRHRAARGARGHDESECRAGAGCTTRAGTVTLAATPPPAAVTSTPPTSGEGPPIDRLFPLMTAMGASDLHLCVGRRRWCARTASMQPLEPGAAALDAARDRRSCSGRSCRRRTGRSSPARHDTDFAYEIPGLARFRANVFADRKGPGAVFRVIPSKILTAEQLGLSPHILQLCKLNKGLVLVTGPTGSGKSTTLCAMIDYINRTREEHIITIEDPIEFVHAEPEVPDQPARGAHPHRLVQGRAARRAARGSGHRPGRRDARPRDGRDRDRDRRDRAPRVRHAAHDDGGVDGGSRSSISFRPTGRRRSASCCRNRCAASSRRTCAARSAAAASRRSRC